MTSNTAAPGAGTTHPQARRAIISSSIGNALEWFDILIYGAFAVVIAKQFFPTGDDSVSLLLTFATFGVSFFMRPLGAVVLGAYSDRAGRKAALMLSIMLMTVGTAMIAFMPSYASIGLLAPAGIALGKMIQGFSAGGEFGSSTAFLVEHAPHRRGFFSSWQVASQGISLLLAAIFGAVLNNMLTPEQLASWGWRVPFIFGLLIAPAGIYIRRHLDEAPEFKESSEKTDAPLRDTFAHQKMRLLIGAGSVIMATVSVYLSLYIPTYAVKQLGLPAWSSFAAMSVAGLIMFIGSPLVGAMSDKIGRTPFMITSSALYIVLTYPMFVFLTNSPGFLQLLLLQTVIGVLMTMYFASMPALLADIFPVATRGTGMSLAYNIAVTIFGGFAGLIITWLIDFTGNKLSVSYFVIFGAVLSLIATLAARFVLRLR
ncbi:MULTISPECIES: MFS transporter [Herbaspirillum]|jgi:MHS family proline/betaine transporter-like MFS transporter|uniref:MFS transporter n=2 Tax=Herbaspirillum huttiense TaxID=863372 RepID=A0AAJ2H8N2_9BURK|nr:MULTISPECIES: MFS transporter [Herbaspirillum]MAF05507.1 MFS transporter [Herbaspirillum sp.]MBN9358263.1 MFS transporter [Herbaspirillum huttiense]MBO14146.1 MFS transporter [Herbaspirillum sp.]MBP1314220.1 MHS family proline/betaine transporter-like MFS transporter [Herbaspirillum sp. 1130]MCO4855126.1 MFS transporter [Herbaspirillum sp. WGmk3]